MATIKNIVLIIIGIMMACGMYNILQEKPFKFEHFKSRKEGQEYIIDHYPVGSDVNALFTDLKKVGATYFKRKEKIPPNQMGKQRDLEYDRVYIAKYSNNWISSDPMGWYDLFIFVDLNNTILHIDVLKWSKFS